MKRLFDFIGTETNTPKDFYKSVVEELKSCEWVKEGDNNKFICESVPFLTFYKMTAIDYRYFEEKNINFRYEIFYSKTVDNQYLWEVNFYEFNERQYGDYLIVQSDDLGLFQNTEEQTTDEDPVELLKKALKLCAEKGVDTANIQGVIEDYDYIYDAIKTQVLDNIGVDDLPSFLIEDAGKEWIDENAADAYDRAVNAMESYEIRDKIIEYLSDNL